MPEFPSREELILQSMIDGTDYNEPPKSRVEYLLLQLKAIIEAWMEGRDLTNHRHDTLVELTSHLRYLIGNNPKKIEEVAGQLQWVKDLAAEGENVCGTIGSVCRDFRLKESIPKPMREALRKVGAVDGDLKSPSVKLIAWKWILYAKNKTNPFTFKFLIYWQVKKLLKENLNH